MKGDSFACWTVVAALVGAVAASAVNGRDHERRIATLDLRLQAVEEQAAQAALNAADWSEFAKELRRLTNEPRWPAPPTNGYIIVTNVAAPPKPATWTAPAKP